MFLHYIINKIMLMRDQTNMANTQVALTLKLATSGINQYIWNLCIYLIDYHFTFELLELAIQV